MDQDLLAFVRRAIRSTWALELLLLMRKQQDASFAAEDLIRTLRASPTVVATCLQQLRAAGLVDRNESGAWRYAPTSSSLDAAAAQLERMYAERPVAVITAILDAPDERLRSFADAFRLPKKED